MQNYHPENHFQGHNLHLKYISKNTICNAKNRNYENIVRIIIKMYVLQLNLKKKSVYDIGIFPDDIFFLFFE